MASWLIERGCSKQDRVAICLPKRIASVECILATLYAGAVYVPIDYTAPVARIKKIVTEAGAVRVITLPEIDADLKGEGIDPGIITSIDNINDLAATDFLTDGYDVVDPVDVSVDDFATFLYTSGSTDTPKGVTLSHNNVATFTRWVVEKYDLTSSDKLSSHAPFHFDLSTMDLYSAFMAGIKYL